MTHAEPKGDFGLLLRRGTERNNRWNCFQGKHGCFSCKGACIHVLNVSSVGASFGIGSMGCLDYDIALYQGHL
jgi:hypothetical protein